MKIDKSPTAVTQAQPESRVGTPGTRSQPEAAPTAQSAVRHLAQTPGNIAQDVDAARVNELRQSIVDGHLVMNTDRIADDLIASVREMLEQKGP